MEGKYLIHSPKDSNGTSNLGTVNPVCDDGNDKCVNGGFKIESSFDAQSNKTGSLTKSCACPDDVPCSCGMKKKNLSLEPWARYKTITMAVGLSLFGLWIIVIAVVAKQGKL